MPHSFTASIENDGEFILLKLTGEVSKENIEEFKKDLDKASIAIENHYKKTNKLVKILLDVSSFSGTYNADALMSLAKFAEKNKLVVNKTAAFSASDKVRMAGEAAIALSHRTNIKIFNTEEDAKAWLL